jgi:hypothetical protein
VIYYNNSCIECSSDLNVGENWTEARRKQGKYLCKSCWHSRDMYINGTYIPKSHPLFKPGKYKTDGEDFSKVYNLGGNKEGYVYIISNPAHVGWVKIGMAEDCTKRLAQYQTSSPHRDFILEYSVFSSDNRTAEAIAHDLAHLKSRRRSCEWFQMSVIEAITILDNLNEHGHIRATTKAYTHTPQDNIQGSLF